MLARRAVGLLPTPITRGGEGVRDRGLPSFRSSGRYRSRLLVANSSARGHNLVRQLPRIPAKWRSVLLVLRLRAKASLRQLFSSASHFLCDASGHAERIEVVSAVHAPCAPEAVPPAGRRVSCGSVSPGDRRRVSKFAKKTCPTTSATSHRESGDHSSCAPGLPALTPAPTALDRCRGRRNGALTISVTFSLGFTTFVPAELHMITRTRVNASCLVCYGLLHELPPWKRCCDSACQGRGDIEKSHAR